MSNQQLAEKIAWKLFGDDGLRPDVDCAVAGVNLRAQAVKEIQSVLDANTGYSTGRFFSYDPDDGISFHDTPEAAQSEARNSVERSQESAADGDGFGEVDDIAWGDVRGASALKWERQRSEVTIDEESGEDEHGCYWQDDWSYMAEYELCDLPRTDTGWVPINSPDDLPKEAGKYWWTGKSGNVAAVSFDPLTATRSMLQNFVAWQSYHEPKPYRETDGGE